MNYRLLEGKEKNKLAEVFPQYASLPLEELVIAGAIDDEERIRGFAVLNLVPHCEPMWIEQGVWIDFRRLVKLLEEKLGQAKELWVFAPNEHIFRMAEICGARDTGWKVLRKEL